MRCLTWLENLARFRPHSLPPPRHPPLPPVIRRRRQRLFLFWGVAALTEVGRWRVHPRPFVALVQVHCQAPLRTRLVQVASEQKSWLTFAVNHVYALLLLRSFVIVIVLGVYFSPGALLRWRRWIAGKVPFVLALCWHGWAIKLLFTAGQSGLRENGRSDSLSTLIVSASSSCDPSSSSASFMSFLVRL